YAEDDAGGFPVDVAAGVEGGHEGRIGREVCEQAKLDLRVICSEQLPPFPGNESAPDVATEFPADGDVLQVGVAGAEATGGCHGLVERCVQPARVRVHERGQGVQVRVLQLREFAVLHEKRRYGVS